MLQRPEVKAAAGSAGKAGASRPYRLALFRGRLKANPICPASGVEYSRAVSPVSSQPRLEAAEAAEALAKADLPEAGLLQLVQAAVPLVARLLRADRAVQEEVLEAEGPVVRAVLAVVAGRTPSSIPRTARFPTPWLLARSPTT